MQRSIDFNATRWSPIKVETSQSSRKRQVPITHTRHPEGSFQGDNGWFDRELYKILFQAGVSIEPGKSHRRGSKRSLEEELKEYFDDKENRLEEYYVLKI